MAKLYLTEFVTAGRDHGATNAAADTGSWTENASSPIPIIVGGNASTAFGANTTLVRVNTDTACSISITTGHLLNSNSTTLNANSTEYFSVHPGQFLEVAVVGSGGTPTNGYVLEDGTTFYVAEDGTTFYVQET